MNKNKILVNQYKNLVAGDIYVFRSFGKKGYTDKKGKLILVRTRRKDKKDEEGKVIGSELVGDTVIFEPLDNYREWEGERLRIYSVTIGCGLFQIFKDR